MCQSFGLGGAIERACLLTAAVARGLSGRALSFSSSGAGGRSEPRCDRGSAQPAAVRTSSMSLPSPSSPAQRQSVRWLTPSFVAAFVRLPFVSVTAAMICARARSGSYMTRDPNKVTYGMVSFRVRVERAFYHPLTMALVTQLTHSGDLFGFRGGGACELCHNSRSPIALSPTRSTP